MEQTKRAYRDVLGFTVEGATAFAAALVADPNNFFLTPFAPCDHCAPGIPAPAR
jgi:hypothetical protein